MTTYNKNSLKTFFEQGDKPTGSDYANLIDSQVNIVETSVQMMGGALQTTELITPRVSATNINVTGTMSAASFIVNSISANILNVGTSANISQAFITNASATNLNVVSANITSQRSSVVTIAASGTTLGTANLLTTARKTLLNSVTDTTATGVGLLANQTGLEQILINDTATSANLWPCTGGQINALASGAAFALAGHTQYFIVHIKASGYTVK